MDDEKELQLNLVLELISFFTIFKGDVKDDFTRLANDLDRLFLHQPNIEVLHQGSGFEDLFMPHVDDGASTLNTDADHMIIRNEFTIIERDLKEPVNQDDVVHSRSCNVINPSTISSHRNPSTERDNCFEIPVSIAEAEQKNEGNDVCTRKLYLYNASHPGYVHVSDRKLSTCCSVTQEFIVDHCLKNSDFIQESRESVQLSKTMLMSLNEGHITGPSLSQPYAGSVFTIHRDFVFALKCKFWPLHAKEWVQRHRSFDWPSDEIISKILSSGCHIVPVGSHTSTLPEFEWRLSFSMAELTLAYTLSSNLKLAYSVLKGLIKTEMAVHKMTIFASYHLKTALFWLIENNGLEQMASKNKAETMFELLDCLIQFYERNCVPNYFVRENNMINHRSQDEGLRASKILKGVKIKTVSSFCNYLDSNHLLPVLFDPSLCEMIVSDPEKLKICSKYNFLTMALVYKLMPLRDSSLSIDPSDALKMSNSFVSQAKCLHKDYKSVSFEDAFVPDSTVLTKEEHSFAVYEILSLFDKYIEDDNLKLTEKSAIFLGVFNVFLTTHPTLLDPKIKKEGMDYKSFHVSLTDPVFKEVLLWSCSSHEKHCDIIYNFVIQKWKNGPSFITSDKEAQGFSKLLMVVLGKPTKQARAATGSIVRRNMEGQVFITMHVLAAYLANIHLECAYIAYQAAAYLMNVSVLSEIYSAVVHHIYKPMRLNLIHLIFTKTELHSKLSDQEVSTLQDLKCKLENFDNF